jgi:hypothetical protein
MRDFEHICHELNNLSHLQRRKGAHLLDAGGLQGIPTVESLDVFRAPWVQKSEAEASQPRITYTFGLQDLQIHYQFWQCRSPATP